MGPEWVKQYGNPEGCEINKHFLAGWLADKHRNAIKTSSTEISPKFGVEEDPTDIPSDA